MADLAGDSEVTRARPAEVQLTLFLQDTLGTFRLVERHLTRHEDVQYHAYRPNVCLLRVVRSTLPTHIKNISENSKRLLDLDLNFSTACSKPPSLQVTETTIGSELSEHYVRDRQTNVRQFGRRTKIIWSISSQTIATLGTL